MPPKILIPAGWEECGNKNGHTYVRCTVKNSMGIQCSHTLRIRKNLQPHQIPHLFVNTPLPPDRTTMDSIQDDIQKEIVQTFVKLNLPALAVENIALWDLVNKCIKIGQQNAQKPTNLLIPTLNRANFNTVLLSLADTATSYHLRILSGEFALSLALDGATFFGRHFIDLVILNTLLAKPFHFELLETGYKNLEHYGGAILTLLEYLKSKKIHIRHIIGDNLPVQVAALAHFSSKSVLQNSQFKYIRYWPCLCHSIQLIVTSVVKQNHLFYRMITDAESYAHILNNTGITEFIGKCPLPVLTRWLSRMETISWLLSKKEVLSNLHRISCSEEIKTELSSTFTEAAFQLLRVLAEILFPLTQLIKLFEDNKTPQYLAVPFFEQVQKTYNILRSSPMFEEYYSIIDDILHGFEVRKHETLDWNLIRTAYLLTPEGRGHFRKNLRTISSDLLQMPLDEVDLKYKPPKPLFSYRATATGFHHHDEEALLEELKTWAEHLGLDPDEVLACHDHQDELLDGSDIPVLTFSPSDTLTHDLLDISSHLLTVYGQDLGLNDDELSLIPRQLLNWIYDQKIAEQIASQFPHAPVIVWNYFLNNLNLHIIARLAKSLLSVPASEAMVEREFSLQKRILTCLANRMKPTIINGRFRLMLE
jgi:hypothetical protein